MGAAAADVATAWHDHVVRAPDRPQPQHPFVACDPPIPVRVRHDDGCWYDGQVTNFTGPRINVRYTVDVGMTHWQIRSPEQVQLIEKR